MLSASRGGPEVWSTCGEMWASLDDRRVVWPPPHVLKTQLYLMREAKRIAKYIPGPISGHLLGRLDNFCMAR